MKTYMIIERFYPSMVKTLDSRFAEKGRMLSEGVHYIDSWIDEKVEVCYQLMKSESIEKLKEWISYWDDLADFEIEPDNSSQQAKLKTFKNASLC